MTGPIAAESHLVEALRESRNRWRDLATLCADIAFETDAWGRFTFLAPDPALGWPAAALLGQPAERLLAGPGGFDPFRAASPVRRRQAWLKRPDGASACLSFAVTPLADPEGRLLGARGIGQDAAGGGAEDTAAALRRCGVLGDMLRRLRAEVLAPRMMEAALGVVAAALQAEGCAVLELGAEGGQPAVLYRCGTGLETCRDAALGLLQENEDDPVTGLGPEARPLLACPTQTRFGPPAALALWRAAGAAGFAAEDGRLAAAATGVVRLILDHDSIQREMARQARTDPLTGLLNRRALLDEIARRIDRLDREGLPATLMIADIDRFTLFNQRHGQDAADAALCALGALLRDTFRPTDLVARLGADEFAVWLDGADDLTAAERAEYLRGAGPRAIARTLPDDAPPGISIGIATRWPQRSEDIATVLHRAEAAMHDAKRSGRGQWRVARMEDD